MIIGRFGRPHGVKGFITIQSFTEPQDNILRYSDWHVQLNGVWKPIKLLCVEAHNKNTIAQIDGFKEREDVATLTHLEIAVDIEQLDPLSPGEYYWYQLVGMKVVDSRGHLLGAVKEIMPTGSNDVLVIEGEKRHLIPYLPGQFVIEVNSSQQIITVDWDLDF